MSATQSRSVRKHQMPRTYPTQSGPGSFPLRQRGHLRTLPGPCAGGCRSPAPAPVSGSPIVTTPMLGQLQLPRVDDLDREDLVPRGELAHRALPGRLERLSISPSSGVEEVGHDHPESALALRPGHRLERGGQVAAARLLVATELLGEQCPQQTVEREPPGPRRPAPQLPSRAASGRRTGRPAGGSGTRPWRRPRLPARASPAATVPKSIEPDRSTSAQVSSSRSAIRSRTCGIVVRAVTAQSIRRTSSPAWYSRASASSVPGPGSRPRCSPCR